MISLLLPPQTPLYANRNFNPFSHYANALTLSEKVVHLSTCIIFLGIFIDTWTTTASLSNEHKVTRCHLIGEMYQPAVAVSCWGKLLFACKVVSAGRIFLCHLIDLSMTVKHLHHHIRISREAQLDIIWWQDFLPTWPRSSLILNMHSLVN